MSNAYKARQARWAKREESRRQRRELGKVLQQVASMTCDEGCDEFADGDNDFVVSEHRPRGME